MCKAIIELFWSTMSTNDFVAASNLLSPDFEYFMPQSGEYMHGRAAFAAVKTTYPAEGKWRFTVRSIVASDSEGVSDVEVTDGSLKARAITFHSVKNGLITRQVEYWPDPYQAPEWRSQWVQIRKEAPFWISPP